MRINKSYKKCYICGKPHTSLCDATNENGEPCDMPMCNEHRNRASEGLDVDVCDKHNNPKDIEQAKKNRIERERAKIYFRDRYFREIKTRALQDMLFDPATRKEVDEWIEKRKQEDKKIIEEEINRDIAKREKKKTINKSIEVLNDLVLYIKNQHMLNDADGNTTPEDIKTYKARFIGLKLGANALKKQIKLMEKIDELEEKENEHASSEARKLVKEFGNMLKEVLIV